MNKMTNIYNQNNHKKFVKKQKKTLKRTYNVGKSKMYPKISVLVSNKTIRNNITTKSQLLKQVSIQEVKKYFPKATSREKKRLTDNREIPDLLSIDIDGIDYFIWESLVVFEPTIIVIEFNPTIPNDIAFVQQKDPRINQGCSLLALIMLGKKKGYELICCTSWNAFFVKKDLFPQFNITNNFISHMYNPILDGRIFQGYDSYIYTYGMDRLLWKNGIPLVSDDFQALPEKFRTFQDAQG
jgi:hypothetical protein